MQIHELNTFTGTPGETDYLAIDTGFDTAKISAKKLLEDVNFDINKIDNHKVNIPLDEYNQPTNGNAGQLLRTNGDGSTEWTDEGLPTDAQTAQAVSDWLADHPEATTTVADGSLTQAKFSNTLKLEAIKDYVTPEMFGAAGDGVTDDTNAVQLAFNSGKNIYCAGRYLITSDITIGSGYASVIGYFKKRVVLGKGSHLYKYNSGSVIDLNINDADFIFNGGSFDVSAVAETTFENVVFMGSLSNTKTDIAFIKQAANSCSLLKIYKCVFANFDKCINFVSGSSWSGENEFRFNFFANCNYAFEGMSIVDSYICGNIFHSSCQYSWWSIGGGTIYSENHDYSQKGCRATAGIVRGNYFDGLNKFNVGISGVVTGMVIEGNWFLYNAGVTDAEQAAITVAFGLVRSTICNNVVAGFINVSGLYPSLILLKGTGEIGNNYINNNAFDKANCSIFALPNVNSLYYANSCNTPVSVSLTLADPDHTTYIIQDLGNETRIKFVYTGKTLGTLISVDYGGGTKFAFKRLADFSIYDGADGSFIKRVANYSDATVAVYAADVTGHDVANNGMKVYGTLSLVKGIDRASVQRQYYAKLITP